jgi:hypothetical protein
MIAGHANVGRWQSSQHHHSMSSQHHVHVDLIAPPPQDKYFAFYGNEQLDKVFSLVLRPPFVKIVPT